MVYFILNIQNNFFFQLVLWIFDFLFVIIFFLLLILSSSYSLLNVLSLILIASLYLSFSNRFSTFPPPPLFHTSKSPIHNKNNSTHLRFSFSFHISLYTFPSIYLFFSSTTHQHHLTIPSVPLRYLTLFHHLHSHYLSLSHPLHHSPPSQIFPSYPIY